MRKKGKLYTANKWNLPFFVPKGNVFDDGGSFDWSKFGNTAGGVTSMIPENKFTIGDTTFKRGTWDAADPMYYAFNSKGRESQAGNTLNELGVQVTKNSLTSGQWWGALAGAVLKVAGDIDNYVAGTEADEDTLSTLNRTTAALNSFNSEAGSYEGLVRPSGMVNYQDVYEGPGKKQENVGKGVGIVAGVLTGIPGMGTLFGQAYARRSRKAREKAERKNNELRRNYENAQAWAENSYLNNLYNIQQDQMNNALRNYSAFGGPIETMPMYNDDMPAVNYDFMTDYLTAKKKQAEQKNIDLSNLFAGMPSTMFAGGGSIHIDPKNKGKFNATKKRTGKTTEELTHSKNPLTRKRAIFAQNARKWHHANGGPMNVLYQLDDRILALGGDIQTHGGDFTTGLTRVDAGSSHELNPNEGVQMGVDQNGVPNLVEEGETVFNDYVYSNRIMVNDDTKKRYGINKKRQITFAELSKKLEKEASERPNDPISQAGLNASMSDLADAQEAEKMRLEAERAKEAFDSLTPEEQTMLMANATQQGNINAYGGNLFAQGSEMERVLEDAHNRITEENIVWLKNRFPNLDDATILRVSDMMITKGAGGLSPEASFKRLVPTQDFSVANAQKFTQQLLDNGVDIDTALSIVSSYVPDRLKSTIESVTTKVRDNIEKENNSINKEIEELQSNKNATTGSTWQNMQAAMGAPADSAVISGAQRSVDIPSYANYYTVADSSNATPQESKKEKEQSVLDTPAAKSAIENAKQKVLATEAPVQTIPSEVAVTTPSINNGLRPYAYDKDITNFAYWNPELNNYDQGYLDFVNNIDQEWVNNILSGAYGDMGRYTAANAGYNITPEEVKRLATDKKYSDMHKAVAAAYKDYLTGINSSAEGISEPAAEPAPVPERDTQVYIATDKGIVPVDASTLDDTYTIEDFDGVKIARKAPQKVGETPAQTEEEIVAEETGIKPNLKRETYMGLFGPVTGLGMMSAGIGRPDYRELDAALTSARTAPRRAGYATIGDYLRYTPIDIWAEQNRLDANTRATDRALMAGISPSRYAGILANNYNAQLASGDLYRKAVEYNDAKKAQVVGFNRGTNQYNADAFTRNSQFNAESANRGNQFATSVALNVAQQKMANEADWYNSLYGNVYGLFDRVNQWEKWKRDHNTVAQMYANGLAGVVDENTPIAMGYVKKEAKGGKLRKKGKNDLTL